MNVFFSFVGFFCRVAWVLLAGDDGDVSYDSLRANVEQYVGTVSTAVGIRVYVGFWSASDRVASGDVDDRVANLVVSS